jgi:glycosyltransferase involved in cell wall biosynthesis
MPKVSIVIPTYNSAQFLDETLQSVFSQTFNDFEIIVIDDGSTDQTRKVLSKYDDRIRYFLQENGGPAKARNRGIRESLGEYIAFLDADDIWLPTKLEKQVSRFQQNPELGMVFTENSCFDQNGIYLTSLGKRKKLMRGDLVKNIFLHSGVATPTVMVRREVFNQIGVFDEELYMSEDDNMWIRVTANFKAELIDEPLAKARTHSTRTTANKKKLYECIQTNVKLLNCRYEDIWERIKDVVPQKLSQLQFDLGYEYFENQCFDKARQAFALGIHHYKWYLKNYIYYLSCFLPKKAIQKIKYFKRTKFLTTLK